MNIPGLITCHKAEVALAARRMVTHGTVPDEITLAVDGSKLIIGVTTLVAASVGEPADVVRSQLTPVTATSTNPSQHRPPRFPRGGFCCA